MWYNSPDTSGVKGVTWVPHLGKWKAELTVDKQHKYLGVFTKIEEASQAYDAAATKYFADFRRCA